MTSHNPRHVISSSQDRLPELVAALAVTAAALGVAGTRALAPRPGVTGRA